MKSNLSIRPEQPGDAPAISNVNQLAFGRPNEGLLVENLRKRPEFRPDLSLVAEIDAEIAGHVLLLPVGLQTDRGEIPLAATPLLSLGPIAVLPNYQGQGIGGKLILAGHQRAQALGYTAIVLLGHPSYYPRFGYKMAKLFGLTNPWKIDDMPWMVIELHKGALDQLEGLVRYPEEFNAAS